MVTRLRHPREKAGLRYLLDHRAADRRHQRIAAKRSALITIFEAANVAVGDQRRQRHAAAQPLGQRHDVGRYAGVLETEQAAGAADPGLDFIEDQQQALVAGQARRSRRNGTVASKTPASPWIGSSITATVRGVMAASTAARSLSGTFTKPDTFGS